MDKKAALSVGSTVLVLAVVLFALGQGKSANLAGNSEYALTASAASGIGGDNAYLPPVLPAPAAPSTGTAPSDVADGAKTQSAPKKTSIMVSRAPSPAELHFEHDAYCNYYAQAVTGNVTPEQAAGRQQANGAIMGAIGGALLGAMFGGSGDHPGRSMALGASSGLVAGAAVGSSNARRAADDIRTRYAEAYSTCMARDDISGAVQPGS